MGAAPAARIVSADDHVVEPPDLWSSRLPKRYVDVGPRVVREPITFVLDPEKLTMRMERADDGTWADIWYYEDIREPQLSVGVAVGTAREELTMKPVIFDDMRPGCFDQSARLADMDAAGIEASLCFPNLVPTRFCGQGFLEAKDKELALLCVEAYNDFIVDQWCAGSGGRLIPCGIVPLWDPELAAAEVRRNAARGMRAVSFSEGTTQLGLPSIHTDHWDPFLRACEETATPLMIHIGSSSQMATPSADSPPGVINTVNTVNTVMSLVDWLFSGVLVRFPELRLCFAEAQIGWIPYYLQRADDVWDHNRGWNGVTHKIPEPPSTYFRSNMHVAFFDDDIGMRHIEEVGSDNVLFETDYPHSDSTWPDCTAVLDQQTSHLGADIAERIARGNARRLFRLD